MNPLISVTATFYFEVSDSEMFGGIGSVGYTSVGYGGITDMALIEGNMLASAQESTASFLKVNPEKIVLISKEAYEMATDESEDSDYGKDEDAETAD